MAILFECFQLWKLIERRGYKCNIREPFKVQVRQPHGTTECYCPCLFMSVFTFFSQMTAHIKDVCSCTVISCRYEHVGCKEMVLMSCRLNTTRI